MAKRFITNWFKLFEYILASYLISTGIALLALLLSGGVETAHWLVKMVLGPLSVFGFSLLYYNGEHAGMEARRMIIVWFPMFVLLDFFVYILIGGFSLRWLFISSQPWSSVYLIFVFISPLFVSYMRD